MKLNIGMRCHDLCPKMEMEALFKEVKANGIHQIQLRLSDHSSGSVI